MIPSNELWLKLGGDKGHGSFNPNSNPNSMKNTRVISVFKAGDTTANLHTALEMYQDHVKEAQGMQIKYEKRSYLISFYFSLPFT